MYAQTFGDVSIYYGAEGGADLQEELAPSLELQDLVFAVLL